MAEERLGGNLGILLSVVSILFVIGLVIFIFTLMGGEISIATADTVDASVLNETLSFVNGTGTATSVESIEGVSLSSVVVEACQ